MHSVTLPICQWITYSRFVKSDLEPSIAMTCALLYTCTLNNYDLSNTCQKKKLFPYIYKEKKPLGDKEARVMYLVRVINWALESFVRNIENAKYSTCRIRINLFSRYTKWRKLQKKGNQVLFQVHNVHWEGCDCLLVEVRNKQLTEKVNRTEYRRTVRSIHSRGHN